MTADVPFPRGGGDSLSAVERKRLRLEAQAEAARDLAAEGPAPKRRKRKGAPDDDEDDLFARHEVISAKFPKFVELLKFKGLSEGVKLLGIISDITSKDLVVALPHGLRGHVSASEASDVLAERMEANGKAGVGPSHGLPSLNELFSVGQMVNCSIINLSNGDDNAKQAKKRVDLSLRLHHTNRALAVSSLKPKMTVTACVKSEEDHGYTLLLGIKGVTGFMRKKDLKGRESVPVGSLVQSSVVSVKGKVVTLRSNPEDLAEAVCTQFDGLTIDSLPVGGLVNARVTSVMKDGLAVAFLTFFSGTIDKFHLAKNLVGDDWATKYSAGQKLKARILYVDPVAKRVGLSLAKHLIEQVPAQLPPHGKVFESAVVRRVDGTVGVLLELPGKAGKGKGTSAAGFAHVSNISDKPSKRIEKEYKPGQTVKARVIGHSLVDGVASLTLRPEVVEQQLLSHADVKPGEMVVGTVDSVEDYGLMVKLTRNILGVVPNVHISDSGKASASKKYPVDKKVTARVLSCDPINRKIVLTLKKALLKTDEPAITSLEDAKPGMKARGTVTGVQSYGVFLTFFGGVNGLIGADELMLAQDDKPEECFTVGQVLKPRVLSVDPARKRLSLSLRPKADKGAGGGGLAGVAQPGDIVQGEVERLDGDSIHVKVTTSSGATGKGLLHKAHLSDHPAGAIALRERLSPGHSLGSLLVLEVQAARGTALLSRKASLCRAAKTLPKSIDDLRESSLVPGYVASVTSNAVYVRFLDRLTGRAGLAQLADTFVTDPMQHFFAHQSVRAQVVQIDAAAGKFSLTLKPALTASQDASLLSSLFSDLEVADGLAVAEGEPVAWDSDFAVGSVAQGEVHEVKDYGVVCDLQQHADLLGLVAHHQAPEQLKVGQKIKGHVLDVNKQDGIVDLSLKPGLSKAPKKAAKALSGLTIGEKVEAVVELVKDEYVVVALPQIANAVGFISAKDFNLHLIDAHQRFSVGQKLQATVAEMPSKDNGGRLLLHAPLELTAETPLGKKKAKKEQKRVRTGDVVHGTLVNMDGFKADVKLGENHPHARLLACHVADLDLKEKKLPKNSPMSTLKEGQAIEAAVIAEFRSAGGKGYTVLELSLRPSDLEAAKSGTLKPYVTVNSTDLAKGTKCLGYCQELENDNLWICLGPDIRGRANLLDCSPEATTLASAEEAFPPGIPLRVTVLTVEGEGRKRKINLSCLDPPEQPAEGDFVVCKIVKLMPGRGLLVQMRGDLKGVVSVCDVHDFYTENPLEGLEVGMFLKGVITCTDENNLCSVSVRPGQGGWTPVAVKGSVVDAQPYPSEAAELNKGDVVKGYVKAVTPKGMFVSLSSSLTARVKLSHLSDGYVEEPQKAFVPGQLVTGRVLSSEGGRVDMTLRSQSATSSNAWVDLEALSEGDIVKGSVKRVEKYGVFIQLDKSTVTGLAHVSELQDGFLKNIKGAYLPGQRVKAKVLAIHKEGCRLNLGLKPSYFGAAAAVEEAEEEAGPDFDEEAENLMEVDEDSDEEKSGKEEEEDEEMDEDGSSGNDDDDVAMGEDKDIDAVEVSDDENPGGSDSSDEDEGLQEEPATTSTRGGFLGDALEAAGDLGWGEVVLRDDQAAAEGTKPEEEENDQTPKKSKAAKKREAREKEAEIRRAELARLEGSGAPGSKEEYEQAVMASPNSSYVWIKYMAFLISLGELPAARKMSERALATISQREENERFNMWVAYINMENIYGEPPEEAVMALMAKALQYTNQKRLYLAVLAIFRKSADRGGLSEQILKAVCRKFNESAKVWLRAYSYHLDSDKPDAAKRTLDRALASLPKRKHIKVLSQVAIMEFKSGDSERGRSIFESVLRNYPKRLDLWSVYLDQEIKAGDMPRCRSLFERVTYLQLPPKKMKFFFKRFLDFEKKHGTAANVEHVKQRAMEFVESINST